MEGVESPPSLWRFGEEISTSEEAGLRSATFACLLLLARGMFLWFSFMCLVSLRSEPKIGELVQ